MSEPHLACGRQGLTDSWINRIKKIRENSNYINDLASLFV
jgi:hypothetical protein